MFVNRDTQRHGDGPEHHNKYREHVEANHVWLAEYLSQSMALQSTSVIERTAKYFGLSEALQTT